MAGSSTASKPAGFMFGAPRIKERKKERKTGAGVAVGAERENTLLR